MTTYTISGTVIYTNYYTDDYVSSDPSGATLEIVVPESVSTLEYALQPPMYDDWAGDATINVQDYNIRINGKTLSDQFSSDGTFFAEIQWTKSGRAQETVLLDLIFYDVPDTGFGRVDGEYIFEISGDPLPNISGEAVYNNFSKRISGIGEADSPYAPDQEIALDSLGAVTVTEADLIIGTDGADLYRTGRGSDTVSGMSGNDKLFGEKGNDQLKGGQGNDIVKGGLGHDKIWGNFGHDSLFGGYGKDILVGGRGRDTLSGMKGNDIMTGGLGRDTFIFDGGKDTVTDFGNDVLQLDKALWDGRSLTNKQIMQFTEIVGTDTVFTFDGGDTLTLIGYNDASTLQSLISVL